MGLEKPIVSFKCIYVKYIEALKTAQLTRAFIKKKKKKLFMLEWIAPVPSPGDLPKPGIQLRCPALQVDSLSAEPQGSPKLRHKKLHN